MLEYIKSQIKKISAHLTPLTAVLVIMINLTACGDSDGDDAFKDAVKVNDLNISSIEIESDNTIVEIGVTETYRAVANIGTGSETKVITNLVHWHSSDPSIVSITSSGVATTLAVGVVEIRAEIADLSATKDLSASDAALESIDILSVDLPATVGVCSQGYQLIANGHYENEADPRVISQVVTWASTDTSIATVSDEGVVATLKEGAVTFSAARDEAGVAIVGTTDLTVDRDLLTSILVTPDTDVTIFIGANQQFKAMGAYSNVPGELMDITETVDWEASNRDGVTTTEHLNITSTGLASGVTEGESNVVASCAGDPDATPDAILPAASSPAVLVSIEMPATLDRIEINDGDQFVRVELDDLSVQLRAKLIFTGGVLPKDVTDDSDTIWEIKSGAATLSDLSGEEGEVFFTAKGTSIITVFYSDNDGNNVSDEISVVVD